MNEISTLEEAWIFDAKGNVKEVKNEKDKARTKEVYQRAREALRYTRSAIGEAGFRRLSCNSHPMQSSIRNRNGRSQSQAIRKSS